MRILVLKHIDTTWGEAPSWLGPLDILDRQPSRCTARNHSARVFEITQHVYLYRVSESIECIVHDSQERDKSLRSKPTFHSDLLTPLRRCRLTNASLIIQAFVKPIDSVTITVTSAIATNPTWTYPTAEVSRPVPASLASARLGNGHKQPPTKKQKTTAKPRAFAARTPGGGSGGRMSGIPGGGGGSKPSVERKFLALWQNSRSLELQVRREFKSPSFRGTPTSSRRVLSRPLPAPRPTATSSTRALNRCA